jgi:hypothetical protein
MCGRLVWVATDSACRRATLWAFWRFGNALGCAALCEGLRWEENGGGGEVLPGVGMWDIWLVECALEVCKFCVVVATLRREQTRCGAQRFGTGETPVDG